MKMQYFDTLEALSRAAAQMLAQHAAQCVRERGHFTLALSGGGTPRRLYEYLTQEPYISTMPWTQTHLFWGDERYVPPDHPDSNFAMASQAFIAHVPIPAENVHRVLTEKASPEAAACAYETTLRESLPLFDSLSRQKGFPVFDLMLLGMGPDGHTASLFPTSPVLDEKTRWVAAAPMPPLNPALRRITLTFPLIHASKTLLFLVNGKDKRALAQTILGHPQEASLRYPAARACVKGNSVWLLA